VTLEGFSKGGCGLRRIQYRVGDLPLARDGKPNNLRLIDCSRSCLLRCGDDEIADRSALDLGSATDHGKSFRSYACLNSGSPVGLFWHRECSTLTQSYVIIPYMSMAGGH
jgi:hypothetical protein